jgi:hypothetical protein
MLIPMVLPSGHLGKMLSYTSAALATSEYFLYLYTKENNLLNPNFFLPGSRDKKITGSGSGDTQHWNIG